ncbi:MAG: TatD family hydrolase [Candidatus Aenigmatarchaeota archaeon]
MIDVHCHLEQPDYDSDREEVIEKCKKELKAVITSCANPKDFELTIKMVEKHKGFIFATVGIHPEYVKEISDKEKEDFFEIIKQNKGKIVGIGEVGLDYDWVKEQDLQQKQREWLVQFINLAKELNLPLVIHARASFEDALKILEQEGAKKVLFHMFGANHLLKRVVENGYFISLNTILFKSKKHKKIARDVPLENLMIETDSPWLGEEGKRNDPCSVKKVIQKIAEIKKLSFEEVDETTTRNAIKFFDLKI